MRMSMVRNVCLLVLAVLLGGCQSSGTAMATPSPTDPNAAARSEGYSLLFSTLSDESDVDKVLMLKKPAPQVAELVKAIGEFSRHARDNVKNLSREEPAVTLDTPGLPTAEDATRKFISSATSKKILFTGGKELEFRLLLTQHEALNYIQNMADAIAELEPRENRKRFLTQVSRDAAALHDRVIEQMQSPYMGAAK